MSRYIDADVTLETLKEFLIKTAINNVGYQRDVDEACKDIADNRLSVWMEYVPTADVAEVKHGEWIVLYDEDSPQDGIWKCSICDYIRFVDDTTPTNYCPNCGAKMRPQEVEE